MNEEKIFQDNLVKYAEILNNYEKGNYKLDEKEFEFIKQFTKTRIDNPVLQKKVDKIKGMARSERKKYIDNYNKGKEEKPNKTTIQEIAETFDIEEKNIKEETLKSGETLYVVYNNKTGKNIILEDGANNKSLIEELQEIKEKKEDDPDSVIEEDYTDVIEDKALNQNLEVSFVPINELNNYLSSIESLTQEKILELDCLVKNASSLGIEYVNLDHIIGIDKNAKVYEVYYDSENREYKVSGTKDEILENTKEEEEENLNNILAETEIKEMVNQEEKEELDDNIKEEEHKQLKKEYTPLKPTYSQTADSSDN